MGLYKSPVELEDIEIQLLLEGMYLYYGFDFRNYAPASLRRRIWNAIRDERLGTVSALQAEILHNSHCMERFLSHLSVNVTSMFRDSDFYRSFRHLVVPLLRTYPFVRIWHAGCSTGEEVYSMSIVLHEENLHHRCRIYATDINETVLKQAREGVFPLGMMQEYTQSYLQAGGKQSFSQYYTTDCEYAYMQPYLRQNVVFAQHNLSTDSSFNEFNVIFCRNVLIYFNQVLQERVHKLFYDSLCRFGVLGLGNQESLKFTPYASHYEELASGERLYRKIR